jgi:hypothetical protein
MSIRAPRGVRDRERSRPKATPILRKASLEVDLSSGEEVATDGVERIARADAKVAARRCSVEEIATPT